MADLSERVKASEIKIENLEDDVSRHRSHIGDLLTFKSNAEGAMKALNWVLGFVGLSSIATLIATLGLLKKALSH